MVHQPKPTFRYILRNGDDSFLKNPKTDTPLLWEAKLFTSLQEAVLFRKKFHLNTYTISLITVQHLYVRDVSEEDCNAAKVFRHP